MHTHTHTRTCTHVITLNIFIVFRQTQRMTEKGRRLRRHLAWQGREVTCGSQSNNKQHKYYSSLYTMSEFFLLFVFSRTWQPNPGENEAAAHCPSHAAEGLRRRHASRDARHLDAVRAAVQCRVSGPDERPEVHVEGLPQRPPNISTARVLEWCSTVFIIHTDVLPGEC